MRTKLDISMFITVTRRRLIINPRGIIGLVVNASALTLFISYRCIFKIVVKTLRTSKNIYFSLFFLLVHVLRNWKVEFGGNTCKK